LPVFSFQFMTDSRGLLRWGFRSLLGAGLLLGCVRAYEPALTLTANVLVVDGTLTDQAERQLIRLSRSSVEFGASGTAPLSGARVEVLINGTETVVFSENPTAKGQYEAPAGFRGRVGTRYRLRCRTAEGTTYESEDETMPAVPPITRVYDRFEAAGIANAEKTRFTPANLVYIDTQDPADARNFYRWQYTLWEQQGWCATCDRALYVLAPNALSGTCQRDLSLPLNSSFDYLCRPSCWEIIRGLSLNLFADNLGNGRPILGRPVGAIAYTQRTGALVEIRQQGLTAGAWRYFRLLEQQSQNTGGLADTPPAPLVGNVRNLTDPNELVAGYFAATSVASVRYWIDRQNASGRPVGLFEYLNNRPPNPEPGSDFRPPLAICVPSETRTPVMPEGWRP